MVSLILIYIGDTTVIYWLIISGLLPVPRTVSLALSCVIFHESDTICLMHSFYEMWYVCLQLGSGTRFTKHLWACSWNLMKILSALVMILMIKSDHNCGTCHDISAVLFWSLFFKQQQHKLLDYELINSLKFFEMDAYFRLCLRFVLKRSSSVEQDIATSCRCLSGKLWYLQHNCVGDTIVYH